MSASTVRRAALCLAAVLAAGTGVARAADVPSADALIKKATDAMGGAAIDKIESYRSSAEVDTPMGTMTSRVFWRKPDWIIIQRELPQVGRVDAGTDGKIGWMQNPMMGGYMLMEGDDLKQIFEQAIHVRMLNLRRTLEREYQLGEVKALEFDGVPCYAVDLRDKSPEKPEHGAMYFDAATGLIRGFQTEAEGQQLTATLSDWVAVDGVQFFKHLEASGGGGDMGIKIQFSTIELNNADPAVFTVPDEVKALAAKPSKPESEMTLEDFSPQIQQFITGTMNQLPWTQPEVLKSTREQMASRAGSLPGEYRKAFNYIVRKIDERLGEQGQQGP